jgi:DNA-binding beta-propeller fold protein YncE
MNLLAPRSVLLSSVFAVLALPTLAGQAQAQDAARPSSLTSPACSNQVATAPTLPGSAPATTAVPGSPFGVAIAPGGRTAIVSLVGGRSTLAVLAMDEGAPRLLRTVSVLGSQAATGMAVSHDGRFLAVTLNTQTAVLSLPALLAGAPDPVLGVLADKGFGTIEAAFSADDRFLFVSDESSSAISVFDLGEALERGFSAPGVAVGQVPVDIAPVGLALAPDGRLLYATSELASLSNPTQGTLAVIDVRKAERSPATSVLVRANAGCSPVRVVLSAGGRLAWVSARGSDDLLAFDTHRLLEDPMHALAAIVRVGLQPVGVLVTNDGRDVLVADSGRFSEPNTPQTISVVDARAALAGRPALLGTIPAGAFPREFGLDRSTGQVVLTNFNSGTVETFPVPFQDREK